jgi:hypothetical protein
MYFCNVYEKICRGDFLKTSTAPRWVFLKNCRCRVGAAMDISAGPRLPKRITSVKKYNAAKGIAIEINFFLLPY